MQWWLAHRISAGDSDDQCDHDRNEHYDDKHYGIDLANPADEWSMWR